MNNDSRDIELEKKIDSYIKGNLSQEEVDQLWTELFKKPKYISLLQTEIDLTRLYRKKNAQTTPMKQYGKWIAAIAAVIVALVVTVKFWGNEEPKQLSEWAPNKIELQTNLLSAPVTRSATHIPPADSALNTGFKAAVSGDTAQSVQIFNDFLNQYDDPKLLAKAHLNLGILCYNSGSFDESITDFRTAIALADSQPLLQERAYWFMGNAYIKMHQLENARVAVQQTYTMGKLYKTEAYNLLKRLDYELGNISREEFQQQAKSPDN